MSSVPGPVLGPCEPWITGEDVLGCCSVQLPGIAASLDVVFDGEPDAGMRLVAVVPGPDGNAISFQIGRGGSGTTETTVEVIGQRVLVTTSASAGNVVTATANDVIAAIEASAEASALVTIAVLGGDGSAVIPNAKFPFPEANLAGGDISPLWDRVAVEASMALYEISGRLFTGLCGPVTVRPCADRCSCWGIATGYGPWAWTSAVYAGWTGGYWANDCGDKCGCSPLSKIKLNGYPVREIVEVKIGGETLDPSGYRLDRWRELVRLDDPGPPAVHQRWPGCQNLALDDDQPGTFSVSYRYGISPPPVGEDAAVEIACQLAAACAGDACKLPAGVTKIVREQVTIERGLLANWFDPTKPTGLVHTDLFLRSYWKDGGSRRPAVWSPDVRPFPRRVGS